MSVVDDRAKSKQQLVAELRALRAQLSTLTAGGARSLNDHAREPRLPHATSACASGEAMLPEALRACDERFRLFVLSVPDYAMFVLDAHGIVADWNAGAERMIGYRADQIVGRHLACLYVEAEQQDGRPQQQLQLAAAIGTAEEEGWRLRGDGTQFRSGSVITALRGADGVSGGFAVLLHDLTGQRQAQDQAAHEERQRLARELHDSVTQALYAVKLYAEAAARRLAAEDTATAAEYLRELRGAAQEALQEMRLLIFELRPPILNQQGLALAIQSRLEAVEGRAHVQSEFIVEGERSLPAAVEQALYRVAQEALNNALKHARARRISVYLQYEPDRTLLTIVDDGHGFDSAAVTAQHGLGLRGMRERVAQLHGQLTVESTPGRGTIVRVEVES